MAHGCCTCSEARQTKRRPDSFRNRASLRFHQGLIVRGAGVLSAIIPWRFLKLFLFYPVPEPGPPRKTPSRHGGLQGRARLRNTVQRRCDNLESEAGGGADEPSAKGADDLLAGIGADACDHGEDALASDGQEERNGRHRVVLRQSSQAPGLSPDSIPLPCSLLGTLLIWAPCEVPMPFSIRPHRRSPVQCAVSNDGQIIERRRAKATTN